MVNQFLFDHGHKPEFLEQYGYLGLRAYLDEVTRRPSVRTTGEFRAVPAPSPSWAAKGPRGTVNPSGVSSSPATRRRAGAKIAP